MGNNNEQEIKEAVSECNGKLQGREHDLKSILYCPIIPILCGGGFCKYQSGERTKIIENDGGKNFEIPRYLCSWRKF